CRAYGPQPRDRGSHQDQGQQEDRFPPGERAERISLIRRAGGQVSRKASRRLPAFCVADYPSGKFDGDQDMLRRGFLIAAGAALAHPAWADETPGVTATEIRIGNTASYS